MEAAAGRRPWLRRALLIAVAAAALWLWTWQMTRLRLTPPHVAPEASALVLRGSDGTVHDLAELRGTIVLVNLWASWCPPCRKESPGLVSVYEEYRDRGFEILGVNAESLDAGGIRRCALAAGNLQGHDGSRARSISRTTRSNRNAVPA